MRHAIALVLLAATAHAEIVSLKPYVERFGIEAWLGKLNVPRLDAKATSVYGAEEKDVSGAAFSAWVFALQQGEAGEIPDAATVHAAWKRMTADKDWRRKVTEHLVQSWPFGGLAIGDMPRVHAHLDAIALFGADEFHRKFAARRLAYLKGCTKEIPKLPDAALPRSKQIRVLVEGFRRLGPLWSCTSSIPSLYGEPDSSRALRRFNTDAYPDLVIATGDLRPAGRSVSMGGDGKRVTVSFVARTVLRQSANVSESETVLEAWIQSGTWKTKEATDHWMLVHGTTPTTLCRRMLAAKRGSDRHLKNASLLVRMTASAVRNDLALLRANSPDQARDPTLLYESSGPTYLAVTTWCRAVATHHKAGSALLAETLRKAAPMNRRVLVYAISDLEPKAEMEAICAPWKQE